MNKQKIYKALCLLTILLVSQNVLAGCDLDDFPKLNTMRISALMSDAQYNNRPMMIYSFRASDSVSRVVNYYKSQWKDHYAESVFNPWQQISTMKDNCFLTVQYSAVGDSTFGRLLISNIPKVAPGTALGVGVVSPADGTVVSDLKTNDGPKKGRVTIISSQGSVSELVDFYRTKMVNKGWALNRNFSQSQGAVLVFRKGVDETNVVIMPAGNASQILINTAEIK